jgi:hypothetical protein
VFCQGSVTVPWWKYVSYCSTGGTPRVRVLDRTWRDNEKLAVHTYHRSINIPSNPREASTNSSSLYHTNLQIPPQLQSQPPSQPPPNFEMKTNILILLATLTASVMATPTANAEASEIFARGSCYHPSSCSRSWAGKCEDYCGSRGFSHMTGDGCGWLAKKCCCSKK